MRKIFLHMIVSLDGFIEDADGQLDWHAVDDEFEAYVNGLLATADEMIFGRRSFELLAQYWPDAASNPAGAADPERPERHFETARMMNEKTKIVFSNTLTSTRWQNSRIVGGGDFEAEVRSLKAAPGRDIPLFAGASLAASFARLGLIDEYRLMVNPIVLGTGTPLTAGWNRTQLTLVDSRRFASGAILLTYRPKQAS